MSDPHKPASANDNRFDGGGVKIIRTYPVLGNSGKPAGPYWLQCVHAFQAVDILPHMEMRESASDSYLEPCRREQAETWVVIGRYPSGHIEHCERFAREAEASAFRDHLVSRHPHLALREDWKNTALAICPGEEKAPPSWRVVFYPIPDAHDEDVRLDGPCFRVVPGDDTRRWIAQTNSCLPRDAQEEFALLIAEALSKLMGL